MRASALKLITALVLTAALIFSCGCAWIGEALENAGSKPAASDANSAANTPQAQSTEASLIGENPVFAVYYNFFKTYDGCTGGLIDAVYDSPDMTAVRLLMQLMRSEADISLVYATVGLLAQNDDGYGFSGSFSGAFAGSGTITPEGDFTYSFDSGNTIKGRVENGAVECELKYKSEVVKLYFTGNDNGFIAWTERNGVSSVLEIGASLLRFTSFESKKLKDADRSVFPEIEGAALLTYSEGVLKASAAE